MPCSRMPASNRDDLTAEVERHEDATDDLSPVVDARRQRDPVGPEHHAHVHPRYADLLPAQNGYADY